MVNFNCGSLLSNIPSLFEKPSSSPMIIPTVSPQHIIEKGEKDSKNSSKIVPVIVHSLFKIAFNHIWDSKPDYEKIYLTTNEKKQRETIQLLKRVRSINSIQKPTMIAFSSLCGLNFAAVRRIDYIIMIDRSVRVQKFWEEVEKIICHVSNKEEAVQEIITTLTEKAASFWPDCPCEDENCQKSSQDIANDRIGKLKLEIASGVSWLSTSKRFAKIKRIFDKGHFIFKRIDFFDHKKFEILSKTIKKLRLTLDLFYLSNIREYAESSNCLPNFYASIIELSKSMNDYTLIVDTEPRVIDYTFPPEEPPTQRVISHICRRPIEINFPPSPSPFNQAGYFHEKF